ncbi:site-2 protease family protein [Acaryochloris sp. IP29b_bin.148]|uniref:site-2 protease family protein n=1 Tax=Acaryochloris sp. IP29b_bin.148 TaxID=2969218 RepID=UPI00263675A0|nr:site-2 protease family protein [Acaryochloris sp. IP29b_bin.148]
MSHTLTQSKANIDRRFWLQWILCNGLAYGTGVGAPIVLADLQSTQSYVSYSIIAFPLLVLWAGFLQWVVLRSTFSIRWRWVWFNVLATLLLTPFVVAIASILPPSQAPFALTIYPLLFSVNQWRILRQRFQPAWSWIPASFMASCLGGGLGVVLGSITYLWLSTTYGIAALVGGLTGGLLYGGLTSVGLRYLTQQNYIPPQVAHQSAQDTPPGHSKWKDTLISLLPLLVIMGGWSRILPPLSSVDAPSTFQAFIFLGIFYIYQYFAVFIHELGHYCFARATGAKLHRFAVGRFILMRTEQGLKLRRCRQQLAGGFVQTIPQSLHRLDRHLFLMIMGGPAASFFLFCIGALPLLSPNLISNSPIVWCLTFISSLSLHMAIVNTIPFKFGYLSTDGRRMLDLAQKDVPGQRFLALYQFKAYLHQGLRPREIDPDFKNPLLALPENSMEHIGGLMIAYYLTLDQGNRQQAGDYLDQALKINTYYPELFRASLLLEGAYFEAHFRHQPDIARQWLDQIQEKVLIDPLTLLRTEAALLLAEGDTHSAQAKVQEGLAMVQKAQFLPGFTLFEQEQLQALIPDLPNPEGIGEA